MKWKRNWKSKKCYQKRWKEKQNKRKKRTERKWADPCGWSLWFPARNGRYIVVAFVEGHLQSCGCFASLGLVCCYCARDPSMHRYCIHTWARDPWPRRALSAARAVLALQQGPIVQHIISGRCCYSSLSRWPSPVHHHIMDTNVQLHLISVLVVIIKATTNVRSTQRLVVLVDN